MAVMKGLIWAGSIGVQLGFNWGSIGALNRRISCSCSPDVVIGPPYGTKTIAWALQLRKRRKPPSLGISRRKPASSLVLLEFQKATCIAVVA